MDGPLRDVLPEGWPRPKGYSNGVIAPAGGQLLFVAGTIGWDTEERLVGEGFVDQFRQALRNVVAVVEAAGGEVAHIARLTIYVTDREAYTRDLRAVGEAYREEMGKHFPAMALLIVAGLVERGALVEIEATAVLPEGTASQRD